MNKKVLIIIPTLANGGAERVASYLSTGLPEDMQVDLLLREKKIDYDFRKNGNIIVTGGGIRGIIKEVITLKKLKKSNAYDIYNSHMASSNMLNIFSGKKSGKRILTIHAVTSMQMRELKCSSIVNFIIRNFYKKADKIVAVSTAVGDDLQKNYQISQQKIAVIENGNDIKRVLCLREEPLSDDDKEMFTGRPIVTTMGRYTRAKGHLQLIGAFSGVVRKYPDARLLLIGDGELKSEYEAKIADLSLEKNVFLTGYRKNPFNLIKNSDVFVFSSVYEGYGCALAEAMFCGVPVAAVNCPGVVAGMMNFDGECKKVTPLKYGIVCPDLSGDENAENELTKAIIKAYEDNEYAENCVIQNEKRADEFSVENMIEKWVNLFELQ